MRQSFIITVEKKLEQKYVKRRLEPFGVDEYIRKLTKELAECDNEDVLNYMDTIYDEFRAYNIDLYAPF